MKYQQTRPFKERPSAEWWMVSLIETLVQSYGLATNNDRCLIQRHVQGVPLKRVSSQKMVYIQSISLQDYINVYHTMKCTF